MRRTRETRLSLLWIIRLCTVMMLTIVAGQGAHGQTVVGRISGTVQDSNGASVSNATVRVVNSANNSERTAITDESASQSSKRPNASDAVSRHRHHGLE